MVYTIAPGNEALRQQVFVHLLRVGYPRMLWGDTECITVDRAARITTIRARGRDIVYPERRPCSSAFMCVQQAMAAQL